MRVLSILLLTCLIMFSFAHCLEAKDKTYAELKVEHEQMCVYIQSLEEKVFNLGYDNMELRETLEALMDVVVLQKLKREGKL